MWGYIKKALNSTLGTDKFRPLDKLFLKDKALVASDDLYVIIDSAVSLKANTTVKSTKKIKMLNSGSVKIGAVSSTPTKTNYDYSSIKVYLNNSDLDRLYFDHTENASVFSETTINFSENDVITLEYKSLIYQECDFSNVALYGRVVDVSLIEVGEDNA